MATATESPGMEGTILAGIPSIIYGIWGLFVFAPWFSGNMCSRRLINASADIPGAQHPVRRPALWHRHPHRGPYPRRS